MEKNAISSSLTTRFVTDTPIKKKAQIDTSKVYTFTYSFLLSNQRYLLSDAEPKAIYMNVCVCKHWRKCVLKGETKRCSSCQTQDHYQRRAKERKKGRQDRETLLRATITRCRFMQPYSCGSPAWRWLPAYAKLIYLGEAKYWSHEKVSKERREVSLGRKGPAWIGSSQLALTRQSIQTHVVVLLIPIWGSMRRDLYLLLKQAL